MNDQQYILENTILRGVVGSTVHGLAIEGQDDRDEMGIFIESPTQVCGLIPFDHFIQRDQPKGVRSQPGDLDLTLYSLRKFCRLAIKGNPSVLLLLYLPKYEIQQDEIAIELLKLRDAFISRHAANSYLGYLRAQKQKLLGERSPKVSRPELIKRYGYDTKFAMHALRLGFQGIQLLGYKHISVPMPEKTRIFLRSVRMGEVKLDNVLQAIDKTEATLTRLAEDWKDQEPDLHRISDFMSWAHFKHWSVL